MKRQVVATVFLCNTLLLLLVATWTLSRDEAAEASVVVVGPNLSEVNTILMSYPSLQEGEEALFTDSAAIKTGNPVDVFIDGEGFFQVRLPDGQIGYTRNGSFQLDPDGVLVTLEGHPVDPSIVVPMDSEVLTITPEGEIRVLQPDFPIAAEIGRVALARFQNTDGLTRRKSHTLLIESEASGSAEIAYPGEDGVGKIRQGFLSLAYSPMQNALHAMLTEPLAHPILQKSKGVEEQ